MAEPNWQWNRCLDQGLITELRLQLEGPFRLAAVHFSHTSPSAESRYLLRPYMDLVFVMDRPLHQEALRAQPIGRRHELKVQATGAPPLDLPRRLTLTTPLGHAYTWAWTHQLNPDISDRCAEWVVSDMAAATVTDVRGVRYRRHPTRQE